MSSPKSNQYTMVPNQLVALPEEIIDLILLNLVNRDDLLSAALTCRKLSQIITWEDINFCYIRVDLVKTTFWNHLALNPRLATCIRHLELFHSQDPEYPEETDAVVPSTLTNMMNFDGYYFRSLNGTQRAIENVIRVIHHMSNLRRFSWLLYDLVPAIFTAVSNSCHKLEELAIIDTGRDYLGNELAYGETLSVFQNLRIFWYRIPYSLISHMRMNMMLSALRQLLLQRCPMLEELYLECKPEDSDMAPDSTLLEVASWSHLRKLGVPAGMFDTIYEGLQIGRIDPGYHQFDQLPLGNLNSLELDRMYFPSEMSHFSLGPVAPQIYNLSLILQTRRYPRLPPGLAVEDYTRRLGQERRKEIPSSHSDLTFLSSFSHLREIFIRSDLHQPIYLPLLLRIVSPTIQTLIFEPSSLTQPSDLLPSLESAQLLAVFLGRLQRLQRLGFVSFSIPFSSPEIAVYNGQLNLYDDDRLIGQIANACPTLEQLGLMFHHISREESAGCWCKMKRDDNQKYSSYVVSAEPHKLRRGYQWDRCTVFADAKMFIDPPGTDYYWPMKGVDLDDMDEDEDGSGDGGRSGSSEDEL